MTFSRSTCRRSTRRSLSPIDMSRRKTADNRSSTAVAGCTWPFSRRGPTQTIPTRFVLLIDVSAYPLTRHCQHWNKVLAQLPLVDPATNQPFPSPLPRAALPTAPDPACSALYQKWFAQTQASVVRERTNATMQSMLSPTRPLPSTRCS